jgi:putative PEP-CTERM system TPR-repeat lipoprotein
MSRHSMGGMRISARFATTIGAALLLASLTGCNRSVSADQLMQEAQQYRQKGEKKAAIIELKNLLQKQPNHVQGRILLGQMYLASNDPLSAEKELRKAVALGAQPSEIATELGKALLLQGQFAKLLEEFNSDPATPESSDIMLLRANAHLGLAQIAQAQQLFELVLKKNPDLSEALLGLARIAVASSQLGTATQLIGHALDKNPDAIDCLRFNGDLLRMQGDIKAALVSYGKILKLQPDNMQAHIDMATLYIQSGKLTEAKASIDAAHKIAPKHLLVIYTQGLFDYHNKQYKLAMQSLLQVLRVVPDHMPTLLLMGPVQMALGSYQQAEQYLRKYLELSPGNVFATKLLATVALKNNNPQVAIDLLQPLLEANKNDPVLLSIAGDAHMRARQYSKAGDYFQRASNLAPQSAALHMAMGVNYLSMGESARAIIELEQVTGTDARGTEAGILLVINHLRNKENDKALAVVNTMEQQQEKNPLVYNIKGGVLLAQQDLVSARASFMQALALEPSYLPALDNLAQMDIVEKKPEQARQRFEAALAKDKKNAGLMIALAKLAAAQSDGTQAIRWLERATDQNPDALLPAMMLANAYQRSGAKEKALTLARQLQLAHPSAPGALALLAQIEFGNGKYDQALESYTRLAMLQPKLAEVPLRMASVQMAQNDWSGALASARKALHLQADLLEAQVLEVALLVKKESFVEALSVARAVQQQHPGTPVGLILEGDIWSVQKKPQEALKAYEAGFKISKTNTLLVKIHQSLIQTGKPQDANARMLQWLQENPTDVGMRLYLAGTRRANKEYKLAIEQYEKVILQEPKNVAALNDMAWSCQQEKDSRALAFAERAYVLGAGNPAVLDTLGWILLEQGQTSRAVSLLQKASALAPAAAEIRYHLGMGLKKAGDHRGARTQFEQLLASNKDFPARDQVKAILAQP